MFSLPFFYFHPILPHHNFSQVIHGDLKPENILVRSDGRVKLIDFGFSHIVTGEPLHVMGGTVVYSPPSDGAMTYAWDDWAVGVILYAMVTRTLPFSRDDLVNQKDLVLNVPHRISDGLCVEYTFLNH